MKVFVSIDVRDGDARIAYERDLRHDFGFQLAQRKLSPHCARDQRALAMKVAVGTDQAQAPCERPPFAQIQVYTKTCALCE